MKQEIQSTAVGRRKTSVARVVLRKGSGAIRVNGVEFERYFGRATSRMVVRQPLELLGLGSEFDVQINVNGGGSSGQAGACRLAIARALNEIDREKNRPDLKLAGFLTRDPREVERKKYGRHKARKRPQYSKR